MDLYQHFRAEEQPFIDQVLDWRDQVERQYTPVLSDFLDPREQLIFRSIIGYDEQFNLTFHGGYDRSERKRAILAPFYEDVKEENYNLSILQGQYNAKFVSLSHRDLLGTVMSLGLHRKKLGDLIVEDGQFQIICDRDLAMYLQMNIDKIRNTRINLRDVSQDDILTPSYEWKEKDGTVSSTRLDAILKEIYQISRQKAQQLIEKEAVKINHRTVNNSSFSLQPGDLISLKSYGRSQVVDILGETKKQKIRIKTAKLN
ncbi:RNA-binding protein [Alkalibacillus almallahensis]|uniref:YlmH family RNA-binding protein n=1 Tax=Alkalibacillus almallahensis TaxID=1379154 RepID=UPI0014226213|nr:YlmH/Sll1252 family protein [Alkalibacillus almallahensis]NIK10712.1 RNA-binding protein YlmH [Alkalibacillus almallahensis]